MKAQKCPFCGRTWAVKLADGETLAGDEGRKVSVVVFHERPPCPTFTSSSAGDFIDAVDRARKEQRN